MSTVPDWLPGVTRIDGNDSGPWMPLAKWSLLLHTTEGGMAGSIAALRSKNAWPHFIYDPQTDQLVQAVSLNRAGRALRSGGNAGRTNAAKVVQVEIVGHAAQTPNASHEWNANVGRMIGRVASVVPFRVDMPLPFYGQDAGFIVASPYARQRLSWPAWYRFDAICGHQHAPSNAHWDPGKINTAEILAAARGGASSNAPKWPGYIKPGMVAESVKTWGFILTGLGYKGFTMRGQSATVYGPGKVAATKRLQRRHKLNADGIVGPITWAAALADVEARRQ